ncbi:hypothetical protein [Mycobacterium marinum]|uniref:hypothetical protein n=1 Tax=Mycobacterium marinum TaxID=1781 RepID=UPI0023587551|nr:hypothetical protein [Mycobacterium marinum]MDC9006472.1 hypothetical protein [Mycobacterium marinum]
MTTEYDDVPGAERARRTLVAADYAWRLIAAMSDPGDPDPAWTEPPSEAVNAAIQRHAAGVVIAEAMDAGVTPAELTKAELELRRVYLPQAAKRYLAETARERLRAAQCSEPDGPGTDAEDYRVGAVDDSPPDDYGWLA